MRVSPVIVFHAWIDRRFLAEHMELRGDDTSARDALRPDVVGVDGKAAQRAAQIIQRQAGIDQGAEDHVASRAGETVQVENAHASIILSRSRDLTVRP